MFVFNMKLNGNRTCKVFVAVLCIILLIITFFVCYKVIFNNFFKTNDEMAHIQNQVQELDSRNYTNVLKNVHENMDNYIGQKIKFTGYVYRVLDLKENQFVLARDMIISSDYQSVIVGFLCEYDKAKDFQDNTWIEITGEITKGNYHGDMPIVKITNITKVDKPNDEYVYPPDENYIPTSGIV